MMDRRCDYNGKPWVDDLAHAVAYACDFAWSEDMISAEEHEAIRQGLSALIGAARGVVDRFEDLEPGALRGFDFAEVVALRDALAAIDGGRDDVARSPRLCTTIIFVQ